MAQHDFVIANQGFPAFRTDLNNFLQAVGTTHSGTSLPTGAVAGLIWLDTTSATAPVLKYYDGTDNITLATINHSTNTVDFNDSSISTPLTITGNATAGAEIRLPEDTDNGSNYVALKAPDTIASNLTFTLPSADGTANQVLTTNGSGVLSFASVSGGIEWQTIITGATLTAVANRGYWINTTSNACTVTLPASATNGDTIILVDYARKWGTNAVTINQNSLNFNGNTSPNPIYNTNGQSVTLVYSGATKGWIPTVDDDVTLETPQPYSVDFLVVAGGGGSGDGTAGPSYGTGGGGAGGYRTSTQTVNIGTVITVTVGNGGSYVTSGSNSSISGSGLTTITSNGGGYGGANPSGNNGISGGSGGGGGGNLSATGGSGNTPSTSPSQGNNGGTGTNADNTGAGGGGGAGAVGSAGASSTGGNGGNGTASSITGSSVTYAGGGGGGSGYSVSAGTSGGTGGTGGGGNGNNAGYGVSGTANLGGGGGGGRGSLAGGVGGGKGVVILSVPTESYSGTSTGSPTITTSGSNTILKFTDSGTYTG